MRFQSMCHQGESEKNQTEIGLARRFPTLCAEKMKCDPWVNLICGKTRLLQSKRTLYLRSLTLILHLESGMKFTDMSTAKDRRTKFSNIFFKSQQNFSKRFLKHAFKFWMQFRFPVPCSRQQTDRKSQSPLKNFIYYLENHGYS